MSSKWQKTLDDGTVVTKSAGWSAPGCHPTGCGVELYVKDGKLIKVEGDKDNPVTKGRLCVRCLALPEAVYHPDRILYPMKRNPADRGKDKWERISWDEAYDLAVEKITEIRNKYGYESLSVYEGTGRLASIYSTAATFNALQGTNLCYPFDGYSCYGPRYAVCSFVIGGGIIEMDYAGGFADRYDNPEFKVPKYILVWGKEPLKSNADGMWGHAIIELMKLGSKLIVVDPRVIWLATRAEYVLQLRPGTDAALALGLLNVVINEDLYNHEFVENWSYGFDELKERVQEYPVSKVSEITGVPEDLIISAARALSENPVTMTWGVATDQNKNGVQICHALLTLSAITGNLDVPGGTVVGSLAGFEEDKGMSGMAQDVANFEDQATSRSGYQNSTIAGAEGAQPLSQPSPETMAKRVGREEFPAYDMAVNSAQPNAFLNALETDKPYPIRFAWIYSSNFLSPTCSAQPHRWHEALLAKMEFIMATDMFMTPTTMALADLFMPITTFAEINSYVMPQYGANTTFASCINKAVTVGECKSDVEIYLTLGKRLNPEGFPLAVEEYIMNGLNQSASITGMTWKELREKGGTTQVPTVYKKYEKGMLRPDRQPGFNTLSGKFECMSNMFLHFGDDSLPYYDEPTYSQISKPELKDEYPLIMTTGGREYTSFHSEHRQIKSLRAITPDPYIEIHPTTAANLDIQNGQWVYVENMFGKAKLKARVTPIMRPDTVHAYHGWWFPEEDGEAPNLYGVYKSNVNELVPSGDNGKMGFGAPFKQMMCKVYKAE